MPADFGDLWTFYLGLPASKLGFELNVSSNEAKKVQSLRIFFCMRFHPVKHAHLSFPAVSWDYFSSVLDYLQSYPLINRGS